MMATRQRTDPAGSTRGAARRQSTARIRSLVPLLPLVLGCCCITLAHGAMEEMMIAPIEVIEEWGCYDTEIRLTCGNLESKIAILEARFTPRCMEQRTENCVYMDEHSVAHPFASQKVDKLILEETEAGRRFLATLRRNHEREQEQEAPEDGEPGTRELTAGGTNRREGATLVASRSLAKDKRSSLRATLEHLIVRYLRRLTSDDDADGDDGGEERGGYEVAARYRRQSLPATDSGSVGNTHRVPDAASSTSSPPAGGFFNSMEITLLTNDTDTNLTDGWDSAERWEADRTAGQPLDGGSAPQLTAGAGAAAEGYGFSGPSVSELVGARDAGGIVAGGASVSEAHGTTGGSGDDAASANGKSEFRDNGDEVEYNLPIGGSVPVGGEMGELRQPRKKQEKPKGRRGGECDSVRKRVSQLDRFELERSMRNGSFREYNIRNALNYRCSGKNHCSFIFSQDHPFAVVWKEGTVRIKYICMDDFRISKYCGEHLIVGNEVHWEPLDGDTDEDSGGDGGTIAETYHPKTAFGSAEPPAAGDDGGIANGAANDAPGPGSAEPSSERNEGGEDLRDDDESLAVLSEGRAGSPYRRLVRAGAAAGEPRAEALQAATIHSFHNLKILKPVDDEEAEENQQGGVYEQRQQQHQKHQDQQQQQQHRYNDTEMDRNQQETDGATATRNRNRQRQKVFSQDFRVLKILPSNLDVVEDIKQIGNEYYFKKDVEVVVDDSENEIVDSEGGRRKAEPNQPTVNSAATATTELTETLDIVVLPAPTKDIEIYDNELLEPGIEGLASARPEDDISVIGLITPTRPAVTTSSMTAASGGGSSTTTPSPATVPVSVETTLGHWDVDRLDLPESAEENRTNLAAGVDESTPPSSPPFSFNNRTFQTIQETVRKEFGESQGPFPPLGGNYDEDEEEEEEDDFDDDDEADADEGRYRGRGGSRTYDADGRRRLDKSHKKYMSVQRTLLKHPLRQGFLMTPSYPKYYIGDSTCRWTLYAGVHQRIKLTVLDLALRYDEECRDYLQVVDLNTNQTLFHSCTESSRPIEIVSIQERLEVSVRTTTKVIYPKRGVLIHYTALGCELPSPTPGHMRLVRRTEHRVKYVCDPLHVFPDSGETVRELICTAKHTWHRPLPACIEKRATEGSGLVSHYEQKRRYGDSDNMSDKQADTVYDILIPSLIIAGLFVVNGIVFAVIMRYRNKRKQRLDLESKELAEL